DQQESAQRNGLNGSSLIGDSRANQRAKSRHAECVENAGRDQRRRVAGNVQAENRQQKSQRQQPFAERNDHEREYLSEQEFGGRNARNINLQNSFLLALF